MILEWQKYGPRLSLETGILFDYWIYFQHVGISAFTGRSLDGVIVTNRFYQIWKSLQYLSKKRMVKASFERIWDNRMEVLNSQRVNTPAGLEDLEDCLESSFNRCKNRLTG